MFRNANFKQQQQQQLQNEVYFKIFHNKHYKQLSGAETRY